MTQPDFLIIPMVVKECAELRPSDWIVYAVIYWYEHMKDGRCIASNPSIARIASVDDRTVRAALDRLEVAGFIRRDYKDKMRRERVEIKSLVRYAVTGPKATKHKEAKPEQQAIVGIPTMKAETPGEFAERFFNDKTRARRDVYEEVLAGSSIEINRLVEEMKKFILYWTEPNKSGTKEKWQMQETFDVRRRLFTWLSRARAGGSRASAGAGVTV